MLCLPPHCLPGDRAVRELISSGELGEIHSVFVRMAADVYLDPNKPVHWRQQYSVSGYNTLDLGMIVEVLHRWVGRFSQVSARTHTLYPYRPTPDGRQLPVERPDALTINATTQSGALASMVFSGVARGKEKSIEIHGTKGSLRYLDGKHELYVALGNESNWSPLPIPDEKRTQWTAEVDFVRAIRENTSIPYPNPTFDDGYAYMEFTEAVFRSAESGRVVRLPMFETEEGSL